MVARTESEAFFGIPPKEVRPRAPEVGRLARGAGISNVETRAPALTGESHGEPQRQLSSESWSGADASDSDDDNLNGDLPVERLSSQDLLSSSGRNLSQGGSTSPATSSPSVADSQRIAQLKVLAF